MTDPWAFGWTPLLTIVGFFVTIGIAYFGFRTFERWKREKIEEKRIDIAIEALELAYDCREVFEIIRNSGTFGFEYADMPRRDREDDGEWNRRGPFYAILKRTQAHADFFERLAKLRPRYMALFGVPAADSVDVRIKGFVEEIERRCRPIIDRTYAARKKKHWWNKKPA